MAKSQISDSLVPKSAPDWRFEEIDGEFLLYHPAKTQTVYLNETAALVFGMCNGDISTKEIVELLKASYPESPDSLEKDVDAVLRKLSAWGSIEY